MGVLDSMEPPENDAKPGLRFASTVDVVHVPLGKELGEDPKAGSSSALLSAEISRQLGELVTLHQNVLGASTTESRDQEASVLGNALNILAMDASYRAHALKLEGSQSHLMLEILQTWLDCSLDSHPLRRDAIHLYVELASRTRQVPSSLLVRGVTIDTSKTLAGGFGVVFRGLYQGKVVAIKQPQVHIGVDESFTKFIREAVIWRQMKHPFILPFIGVDKDVLPNGTIPCLISPWAEGETLAAYISREAYKPQEHLHRLLLETAEAVAYLHSQGAIHGDLKDVNILINGDGHVQLADFGLVMMDDTPHAHMSTSAEKCGTTKWSSPECLEDHRRTMANDVYAFACVAYMLHQGKEPFHNGLGKIRIASDVIKGRRPVRPTYDLDCLVEPSDAMWLLIERCWDHDPSSRPPMSEVLRELRDICSQPSQIYLRTSTGGGSSNTLNAIFEAHQNVMRIRSEEGTGAPVHPRMTLKECVQSLGQAIAYGTRDNSSLKSTTELGVDDTLHVMDAIQAWLDLSSVTDTSRSGAIDMLVKLSASSRQSSSSLYVHGVIRDRNPFQSSIFADVFRGTYKDQPVAVKRLRFAFSEESSGQRRVRREVLVWRQLKHPFILPFIGIHTDESSPLVFIVSPWMNHGTLADYMKAVPQYRREIARLILETAEAILFLHVQSLVHGNLSDSNILISDDGHVQLSGFSRIMASDEEPEEVDSGTRSTRGGSSFTICWMAPELLERDDSPYQSSSADIYAFACICYTLYAGHLPFVELTRRYLNLAIAVVSGKRPERPPQDDLSDDMWSLVSRCWAQDPPLRPNIVVINKRLREIVAPASLEHRPIELRNAALGTQEDHTNANTELAEHPLEKRSVHIIEEMIKSTLPAPVGRSNFGIHTWEHTSSSSLLTGEQRQDSGSGDPPAVPLTMEPTMNDSATSSAQPSDPARPARKKDDDSPLRPNPRENMRPREKKNKIRSALHSIRKYLKF